jgi:hypothetical protein
MEDVGPCGVILVYVEKMPKSRRSRERSRERSRKRSRKRSHKFRALTPIRPNFIITNDIDRAFKKLSAELQDLGKQQASLYINTKNKNITLFQMWYILNDYFNKRDPAETSSSTPPQSASPPSTSREEDLTTPDQPSPPKSFDPSATAPQNFTPKNWWFPRV